MSTPEQRARWLRVASAVDLNTNATARLAAVAYKEAVPALLDEVADWEAQCAFERDAKMEYGSRLRAAEATIKRLRSAIWNQVLEHHETSHSGPISNCGMCSRSHAAAIQ